MPGPRPFPCGGPNQMACPPSPAMDRQNNALNVLRWYYSLPEVHRVRVEALIGPPDEDAK